MTKMPFADFDLTKFLDPSKFMDFTKMTADLKVPGVDVEGLVASQRKNIEAVTAANQLAVEGLQAIMRRQAEIVRQAMEESQGMLTDLMTAGTPEEKIARQTDLVKGAFEKALANAKELAEMVAKSNAEAADVLSTRIKEQMDELKSVIGSAKK